MLIQNTPFHTSFLDAEIANQAITECCLANPDRARTEIIGQSEEGRPVLAAIVGTGPKHVSLLAGAHADEPVGPDTLRRLIPTLLDGKEDHAAVLDRFTFFIIPHVNPDGEARNRGWIDAWPDWKAYTEHVVRELPGRDIEFGYPDLRHENRAVSKWLAAHGPYALHMSLHGMGFSDGAMLLIEKNWSYRTEALQGGFAAAAAKLGLRLHDHNRKGEKGFFSIAPGYTTTPEGVAMRTYFQSHGQAETAALFQDSSMEFVRSLGGDPLSVVTELPLFVIEGQAEPGIPTSYLEFRARLPEVRLALARGEDVAAEVKRFGLNPLPISEASALQLTALNLSLQTVLAK
jgi:hypothetical protein